MKSLFAAATSPPPAPLDPASDIGIQLSPPLNAAAPPAGNGLVALLPYAEPQQSVGGVSAAVAVPAAVAASGSSASSSVDAGMDTKVRRVVNPAALTWLTAGMASLTDEEPAPMFVWQEGEHRVRSLHAVGSRHSWCRYPMFLYSRLKRGEGMDYPDLMPASPRVPTEVTLRRNV